MIDIIGIPGYYQKVSQLDRLMQRFALCLRLSLRNRLLEGLESAVSAMVDRLGEVERIRIKRESSRKFAAVAAVELQQVTAFGQLHIRIMILYPR